MSRVEWSIIPAERFPQYASLWDEVNRRAFDHILLDSRFVVELLRQFAGRGVLLAMAETPSASVLCLLQHAGPACWTTFQPSQAPLGLAISAMRERRVDSLFRSLFSSLPSIGLQISITQQDPAYPCFVDTVTGLTSERIEYIQTPRLSLRGTYEDYWKSRSSNLRHNLDRQSRRLAENQQTLELRVISSRFDMPDAVRAHAALESSGWKSGAGTAVDTDNSQGRFYTAVLEAFAETGEGCAYQLVLDGKVAASDLCLRRSSMMVILKTAYDESLKGISPGLLLHRRLIQNLYARGDVAVVEFYGRMLEWHSKFTDDVRTMYHLNVFRNAISKRTTHWFRSLRRLMRGVRS